MFISIFFFIFNLHFSESLCLRYSLIFMYGMDKLNKQQPHKGSLDGKILFVVSFLDRFLLSHVGSWMVSHWTLARPTYWRKLWVELWRMPKQATGWTLPVILIHPNLHHHQLLPWTWLCCWISLMNVWSNVHSVIKVCFISGNWMLCISVHPNLLYICCKLILVCLCGFLAPQKCGADTDTAAATTSHHTDKTFYLAQVPQR